MKDERGKYYTPSLQHPEVRMYVRDNNGSIEFRLYNPNEPIIWENTSGYPTMRSSRPQTCIKERDSGRNPMALYDLDIAKKLLSEESITH